MRPPDTVYRGERVTGPGGQILGAQVWVGGWPLTPAASLKLVNHSPTGFEWGYPGSGPSQLALALVYDATDDRELALRCYQWFKVATVANWGDRWQITAAEVRAWVQQCDREREQRDRMRDSAYVPTLAVSDTLSRERQTLPGMEA